MSGEDDFDVDQYRKPHESNEEWYLRRSFLLAHHEKFSLNRLLCLANCFVVVECYGCKYPDAIMRQLVELSKDLTTELHEHRNVIKKSYEVVKFVKATPTNNETDFDRKGLPGNEESISEIKASVAKFAMDPEASCSFTNAAPSDSTSVGSHRQELEEKFYKLSNNVKSIGDRVKGSRSNIDILQMALDKTRMTAVATLADRPNEKGLFSCSLKIDFVHVADGAATTKKAAKHAAFEKAAETLRKPYLRVERVNENCDDIRLISDIVPFEKVAAASGIRSKRQCDTAVTKLGQSTKSNIKPLALNLKPLACSVSRKRPSTADDISDVVLLEPATDCLMNVSIQILQQTSTFNRREISYEFPSDCRCKVTLDGQVLADIVADTKAIAKSQAADKALEFLRKRCTAILLKSHEDADLDDAICRDVLVGSGPDGGQKSRQTIPESNVGSRLLKKMGWTGGGMGKDGDGISEPVSLDSVINREGLGLAAEKGIGRNFTLSIQQKIEWYTRSDKQDDLVFSPAFSKEERAVIHQEAHKYHLKTRSYGREGERYLVLSRKRTPLQLVAHILANGGETIKYLLRQPLDEEHLA